MKKIIASVCVTLLCTTTLFADPIDLEKAQQLAQNFMPNNTSAPSLVKKAVRKNSKGVRLSAKVSASAPYYIFSRGKGLGFVIVSGDDALPEVLGYTETGDFDEDNLPPFLSWYLEYYGDLVESAQAANAPRRTAPLVSAAANRVDIAPLLKTHWHQSSPYNDKCPTLKAGGRSATGCVATAASQILYYWRKDLPTATLGSTSSYTYGSEANATTAFPKGTKMKWDLMREQYYGSEPSEYTDAVATLVAFVGGGAGLTYGSSTAGYNDNCRAVFSNSFNLNGGTENNKDWGQDYNNYSDDAWATLLYNELIKQRPVLYSGVSSGGDGHAVVVDGYQASTGYFHINMGWGGQSDGYYTVARGKDPNWGFNNSWQECVTGVYPKKQNLSAEFISHATVYMNRSNEFTFEVKNNGTLDYSNGIYLFAGTTTSKPGNLSSAKSKDTETVIPNTGEAVRFTMSAKPTTEGTWYITVTDGSLNVLATLKVETVVPESQLYLKSMSVDGSTDTEIHNGESYKVVYNSKATGFVELQDKGTTGFEGSPRMLIYESTDDGKTFNFVGYKTSKAEIAKGGKATLSYSITSTSACPISVGNLYYGIMKDTIDGLHVSDVLHKEEASDTIIRFVLKGSNLVAAGYENGCLKLTGTWDVNAFTTLAKKTAYKQATSYDLTEVDKISDLPVPPNNPNALYYLNENANPSSGYNYIKGGVCAQLSLVPGYDFQPLSDFRAEAATLNINQPADKWGFITVPFDAVVATGIVARQIDSHTSAGINGKTTNVTTLQAGHTYEVMPSSSAVQQLTGVNVNVKSGIQTNADTAVVGTYVNTTTPSGAMQINDADPQWIDFVDEGTVVEALRGYFYATNVKKTFRAYAMLAHDPTYLILAKSIESAYQAINEYEDYTAAASTNELKTRIEAGETAFSGQTMSNSEVSVLYLSIDSAVTNYIASAINPDMDLDCTSFIVNPSFEEGNTNGWTTDGKVYNATSLQYKSVNADGTYYLLDSQTGNTGSGVSQTVHGLYPGYYRLTAMVGSTEGHQISVFAGDSTVTVDASDLGSHYLTKAVINDIYVDETGELEIGVKAGYFYKVDNFTLTLTKYTASLREDVNGDGSVDTQDVLKVYEYIQESTGGASEGDVKADVNGDGMVDTQDVLKIYEYIQNN